MTDGDGNRLPGPALYVSADLRWWIADAEEAPILGRDVTQRDDDRLRTYRRAEPAWLTYLASRMAVLRQRRDAGQMAQESWSAVLCLWDAIVHQADQLLGCPAVEEAINAPVDARYLPPPIPAP